MIFEYQAINQTGAIVTDTIIGESLAQARTELSRRGLTPIKINKGDKSPARSHILKRLVGGRNRSVEADPKRATRRNLPFFTSQMSILLETGTTVAASLTAIEKQISDPHWRHLVFAMHRHVAEGGSLASAAALYPNVFDSVYTNMISAGESSGNLSDILNRLAELSRQSDRLRHKLISAMIYPVLLTIISFSVMIVLTFFVLPRFAAIFEEMNVNLPGTTKALLALSDFVRQRIVLTVVLTGGVIGSIVYWLRSQSGRRFVARTALKVPIFGSLVSSIIYARIFRLLGLLVESSVPLIEALELTINATRHYMYSALMARVHDSVLHGRSMYEVLIHSPLLPASIAQMVHTGEENGRVGRVMTMLADYLDDRNETRIGALTSIMEPIILIFMGLIVGVLVISLVLPMFDLSQISA